MSENKTSKTSKANKQGEKATAGRPALTLKYPGGKFTVNSLLELNPEVCRLTVINHIKRGLEDKSITKLDETRKPDGPGRPSELFVRTSRMEAWKNLKQGRKGKAEDSTETPAETPATEVAPAEPVTA